MSADQNQKTLIRHHFLPDAHWGRHKGALLYARGRTVIKVQTDILHVRKFLQGN